MKSMKNLWPMLALLCLGSCLPIEENNQDGQIVVVGNGSEWTDAVVVDVKNESGTESLIYSKQNLTPVGQLIRQLDAPSRVDWLANNPNGETLLQVQSREADRSDSRVIIKTDVEGRPADANEFKDLEFSSEFAPLYLSDRSLLYVNLKKELRWSRKGETGILLAVNFDDFFVTERGILVIRIKTLHIMLRLKDLKNREADLSKEDLMKFPRVNSDCLFVGTGGKIFVYKLQSENQQAGIYEFDFELNKLRGPVLASLIAPRIEKFVSNAKGVFPRDRFVGVVRVEGRGLAVAEITDRGVRYFAMRSALTTGAKVVAGPRGVAIFTDHLEVCDLTCFNIEVDGRVEDLIFNSSGNIVAALSEKRFSSDSELESDRAYRIEELRSPSLKGDSGEFISVVDDIVTDELPLRLQSATSVELEGQFKGFRKFSTPPSFKEKEGKAEETLAAKPEGLRPSSLND